MEASINIMEEDINNIKTRDELKKYFETGDRPTETQFAELIDSYAHLNEFNFGLSVSASGDTARKYYHFYTADNARNSGVGHKIVEAKEKKGFPRGIEEIKDIELADKEGILPKDSEPKPENIKDYSHILSRTVLYKNLDIELIGVDIKKHQPKIIIERYKQKKKLPSGYRRPAKFYQELDAELFGRKSEYIVEENKITLDIEPIRYFRPRPSFKDFLPSGSLNRKGSFKCTKHYKTFVPLRLILEIYINEIPYRSKPVDLKIILGSDYEPDAINFIFN